MEEKNFDEMRQQISILKNKLDNQEIVSDRLMRETMKVKVTDIDRTERMSYVAAIFCIVLYPLLAVTGILSWMFSIATCLMMLFCIVATIYIHRPIHKTNLMTSDLATVARVMDRFKKQYDGWLYYICPALLIPWLAIFCYDFVQSHSIEGINPIWMCLPLIVGAAIGLIIGLRYHFRAVKAAKSIIEQIEGK